MGRPAELADRAQLREAIRSYSTAFRICPGHYLSGINAVMLMQVYRDLTGDPRYDAEAAVMTGGVAWAASCERDEANAYLAAALAKQGKFAQAEAPANVALGEAASDKAVMQITAFMVVMLLVGLVAWLSPTALAIGLLVLLLASALLLLFYYLILGSRAEAA